MRANGFSRGRTASQTCPPTFSKYTSTPSGVAALSWPEKSCARWLRAASKPSSRRGATLSAPPPLPPPRAAGGRARGPPPAGRRDDHRLTRLGLADLGQAGVGGEPGHAEHAERGRDRHLARVERAEPLRGLHRVGLPAAVAEHDVARLEARVGR